MRKSNWKVFTGKGRQHDRIMHMINDDALCPPWRNFKQRFHANDGAGQKTDRLRQAPRETDDRGEKFVPDADMIEMVNAALYLRRPMLITGKPGTGKSTLIYAVAHE